MNTFRRNWTKTALIALIITGGTAITHGQVPAGGRDAFIRIQNLEGSIEVMAPPSTVWIRTQTNQVLRPFFRVRTGPNTRATLLWSDASVVTMNALTEIEILPPHRAGAQPALHLLQGITSFFHRGKPGSLRTITRGSVAGIDGTEFVLDAEGAAGSQQTTLAVLDGIVTFSDPQGNGTLILTNDQQATVIEGQQPVRVAGFIAENILQWACYYPAVLDLNDLPLTAAEREILAPSLAAYREGDLHAALDQWPANRAPQSNSERLYHAALLLSVGQTPSAGKHLAGMIEPNAASRSLAAALRLMAATASHTKAVPIPNPQSATELLAASYDEQSRAILDDSLRRALELARRSVERSPEFAFGWARVAELEFSFGRTRETLAALNKSLTLAPRNAQAIALKGFVQAAQNRTSEALQTFNDAIAADSALGNAWLGRGLVRIRRGDRQGGHEDLLIAAAIEPRRSLLRSYLAKAWNDGGDPEQALKELALARRLDPADPTPWLYSALLNEQGNRLNEAIRDLERSQELNNNRRVYRSKLLLDEDRAVGGANLARIYKQADFQDLGLREASRAVSLDSLSASAHMHLAESLNSFRDPNQINLRYETPVIAEYLMGNLLRPVAAGVVSPAMSYGEYSKLFESKRMGIILSTDYASRGAWEQSASQFGIFEKWSYSLDGYWRSDNGERSNSDVEQTQFDLRSKHQLGDSDSLLLWVQGYKSSAGDLNGYFDNTRTNLHLDLLTKETHRPLALIGLHHQWNPESRTLVVGAYAGNEVRVRMSNAPVLLVITNAGELSATRDDITVTQDYDSEIELMSGELQQIWRRQMITLIAGARVQRGVIDTQQQLSRQSDLALPLSDAPDYYTEERATELWRESIYGYWLWEITSSLQTTMGASYDWMTFPRSWRFAPNVGGQQHEEQLSPKAGFIWSITDSASLRGAYARSLGGASFDSSLRIEPTQIAGFNQVYRSLVPESQAGANAAERQDVANLLMEKRFLTGTIVGIGGEWLESSLSRHHGTFVLDTDIDDFAFAGSQKEELAFREMALRTSVDQLVGQCVSLGANYRLSSSEFETRFKDPSIRSEFQPREMESRLHHLMLRAAVNHSSGMFARFHAHWMSQENEEDAAEFESDPFWYLNFTLGWRSPKNTVETSFGLLNLTDEHYKLLGISSFPLMPRERTLAVRLTLSY